MNRKTLSLIFLLTSFCLYGQVTTINENTESLDLQNIATVYKDASHGLTIEQILKDNSFIFKRINHLNTGITYTDYWVKFNLKNVSDDELDLFLAFESMVNDTLFLYKVINNKVVESTIMGEYLPFSQRQIKHPTPIFEIHLLANEQVQYFVKTRGNGQPMNLTASLLNAQGFHNWDVRKMFFLGVIYGIIILIIVLNISFFLITKEKIYLIFSGQFVFSALCIAYFDGFVYQYIFPNNGYWSNETIAIAMCLTFLFNNRFTSDFFNLKNLAPWAYHTFRYSTYLIYLILAFSFVHPVGFNTFIVSMTAITSLVALLLFASILAAKRRGFASYIFGLVATVCLIFFGSAFQLFLIGLVPGVFFTHYAMHLGVATQSVFLALAVNDKFRLIREENTLYQVQLVEAMNQYSQNLINNIEGERQRLASEIHDGLGQHLLVIRNKVLMSQKKKMTPSKHEETLEYLLDVTTDALEDTRAMSHNLRPPILNTMGLTVAIQSLVEKMRESSSMKINLDMIEPIDGLIQKELEINIYRILQESFNNAFKHASATKIDIKIKKNAQELWIEFADNGKGFNPNTAQFGQGLVGIKERVSLMKGTILIASIDNKGTHFFIKIPFKSMSN
jgi:two-component system, sensor histidine kinase LadS